MLREKCAAVISVTGEYNTEITRHGNANLYVECGYEDAGATTKGYTATSVHLPDKPCESPYLLLITCAISECAFNSTDSGSKRCRIRKTFPDCRRLFQGSLILCIREITALRKRNCIRSGKQACRYPSTFPMIPRRSITKRFFPM